MAQQGVVDLTQVYKGPAEQEDPLRAEVDSLGKELGVDFNEFRNKGYSDQQILDKLDSIAGVSQKPSTPIPQQAYAGPGRGLGFMDIPQAVVGGIGRGVESAGYIAETAGAEGIGQTLKEAGQGIGKYGPQLSADDSMVRKMVVGGIESLPETLIPMGAGVAAGAVAGGGLPGAVVGGTVGALTGLGWYGPSSYGRKKEEALQRGLPIETAHEAGIREGLIQGGIEAVSTPIEMATFGLGKMVLRPGKEMAKEAAKKVTDSLVKRYLKTFGTEAGTEVLQDYLSNQSDQIAGLVESGLTPQQIFETIGATMVTTALLGGGVQLYDKHIQKVNVQRMSDALTKMVQEQHQRENAPLTDDEKNIYVQNLGRARQAGALSQEKYDEYMGMLNTGPKVTTDKPPIDMLNPDPQKQAAAEIDQLLGEVESQAAAAQAAAAPQPAQTSVPLTDAEKLALTSRGFLPEEIAGVTAEQARIFLNTVPEKFIFNREGRRKLVQLGFTREEVKKMWDAKQHTRAALLLATKTRKGNPIKLPPLKGQAAAQQKGATAQTTSAAGVQEGLLLKAQEIIDAVDQGGVPTTPTKINAIARALGLDVKTTAPIEETIQRVRDYLARAKEATATEAAPTEEAVGAKPVPWAERSIWEGITPAAPAKLAEAKEDLGLTAWTRDRLHSRFESITNKLKGMQTKPAKLKQTFDDSIAQLRKEFEGKADVAGANTMIDRFLDFVETKYGDLSTPEGAEAIQKLQATAFRREPTPTTTYKGKYETRNVPMRPIREEQTDIAEMEASTLRKEIDILEDEVAIGTAEEKAAARERANLVAEHLDISSDLWLTPESTASDIATLFSAMRNAPMAESVPTEVTQRKVGKVQGMVAEKPALGPDFAPITGETKATYPAGPKEQTTEQAAAYAKERQEKGYVGSYYYTLDPKTKQPVMVPIEDLGEKAHIPEEVTGQTPEDWVDLLSKTEAVYEGSELEQIENISADKKEQKRFMKAMEKLADAVEFGVVQVRATGTVDRLSQLDKLKFSVINHFLNQKQMKLNMHSMHKTSQGLFSPKHTISVQVIPINAPAVRPAWMDKKFKNVEQLFAPTTEFGYSMQRLLRDIRKGINKGSSRKRIGYIRNIMAQALFKKPYTESATGKKVDALLDQIFNVMTNKVDSLPVIEALDAKLPKLLKEMSEKRVRNSLVKLRLITGDAQMTEQDVTQGGFIHSLNVGAREAIVKLAGDNFEVLYDPEVPDIRFFDPEGKALSLSDLRRAVTEYNEYSPEVLELAETIQESYDNTREERIQERLEAAREKEGPSDPFAKIRELSQELQDKGLKFSIQSALSPEGEKVLRFQYNGTGPWMTIEELQAAVKAKEVPKGMTTKAKELSKALVEHYKSQAPEGSEEAKVDSLFEAAKAGEAGKSLYATVDEAASYLHRAGWTVTESEEGDVTFLKEGKIYQYEDMQKMYEQGMFGRSIMDAATTWMEGGYAATLEEAKGAVKLTPFFKVTMKNLIADGFSHAEAREIVGPQAAIPDSGWKKAYQAERMYEPTPPRPGFIARWQSFLGVSYDTFIEAEEETNKPTGKEEDVEAWEEAEASAPGHKEVDVERAKKQDNLRSIVSEVIESEEPDLLADNDPNYDTREYSLKPIAASRTKMQIPTEASANLIRTLPKVIDLLHRMVGLDNVNLDLMLKDDLLNRSLLESGSKHLEAAKEIARLKKDENFYIEGSFLAREGSLPLIALSYDHPFMVRGAAHEGMHWIIKTTQFMAEKGSSRAQELIKFWESKWGDIKNPAVREQIADESGDYYFAKYIMGNKNPKGYNERKSSILDFFYYILNKLGIHMQERGFKTKEDFFTAAWNGEVRAWYSTQNFKNLSPDTELSLKPEEDADFKKFAADMAAKAGSPTENVFRARPEGGDELLRWLMTTPDEFLTDEEKRQKWMMLGPEEYSLRSDVWGVLNPTKRAESLRRLGLLTGDLKDVFKRIQRYIDTPLGMSMNEGAMGKAWSDAKWYATNKQATVHHYMTTVELDPAEIERMKNDPAYSPDRKNKHGIFALTKNLQKILGEKIMTQSDADSMSADANVRRLYTPERIEQIARANGVTNPEDIAKLQKAYFDWKKTFDWMWTDYLDRMENMLFSVYEGKPWVEHLKRIARLKIPDPQAGYGLGSSDVLSRADFAYFQANKELRDAYSQIQKPLRKMDKMRAEQKKVTPFYMPRIREAGEWWVVKKVDGVLEEYRPFATQYGADSYMGEQSANAPAGTTYEIQKKGKAESEFDGMATQSIDAFVGRMVKAMEAKGELDPADVVALQTAILDAAATNFKARGHSQHMIARNKEGKPIKGYVEDDPIRIMKQYSRGMAGSLSRTEFIWNMRKLLKTINPSKDPDLYEGIANYAATMAQRNVWSDKAFNFMTSLAAMSYLGFSVRGLTMQATQNLVLGFPYLQKMMKQEGVRGSAEAYYGKAMSDVAVSKIRNNFTREENDLLNKASDRGDTGDLNYEYMLAGTPGPLRKLADYSMLLFSRSEIFNRKSALIAAWRVMKAANPNLRLDDNSYRKAVEFVHQVHFPIGKLNQPEIFRAKGMMAGLGRQMYLFRSFPHNMITMLMHSASKREFDVIARSMAYILILGGVAGLPFLDDLMDVIERLTGKPYRLEAKSAVKRYGNDWLATVGTHGIPALMGVDLSNSLKLGMPFTDGVDKTLFGAMGGLETKLEDAGHNLSMGNYGRASEALLPFGLSQLIKTTREAQQGVSTAKGRPVFDATGRQQLKPTPGESALSLLGFKTERRGEAMEMTRSRQNVEEYYNKKKANFAEKFRNARLAQRGVTDLAKEVQAFNAELRQRGAFRMGLRPITISSLANYMSMKPSKKGVMFSRYMNDEE